MLSGGVRFFLWTYRYNDVELLSTAKMREKAWWPCLESVLRKGINCSNAIEIEAMKPHNYRFEVGEILLIDQ